MSDEMSSADYQAFLRDGRLPARLLDDNSGDDSLGTQDAAGATKEPQPDPDTASTQSERLGANTASQVIRVTVPMDPPSALMPNQLSKNGTWHKRSAWRKACRDTAKYAAMEQVNGKPIAGPVHVTIHAAYGVDTQSRAKTKRMRTLPDLDGTCAAVKPMIDGLADAGLIYDDDQMVRITATHERLPATTPRPIGYTIITIQEIEP